MLVSSISLGEGNTPLVPSRQHPNLYFKLENTNPTGSYKDRFIAAELAHLVAQGQRACIATSSGNTGSSLAAYCASAGLSCTILVNSDVPSGKLLQMQAHGARLIRIPQFVTQPEVTQSVFATLTEFTRSTGTALVVSAFRYCPAGMAGVRSIGFEIAEALPAAAHVFAPAGSGGLFVAVSQAIHGTMPGARVHAVQPEGCATIVAAFRSGAAQVEPVASTTRISGLSVPFDIDGTLALETLRAHGGSAIGVVDEAIWEAQQDLYLKEGIMAEPAGAAAYAGYRAALAAGTITKAHPAVAIVSGHGFKDPASLERIAAIHPATEVSAAELGEFLKA